MQDRDGRAGRRVLIADPECARRTRLSRRSGENSVIEAASLCEAFPLAESAVPDIIALSADFLVEPEVEGLFRLADMLECRMFLYTSGARPARGQAAARIPCVSFSAEDSLEDLLMRFRDPRCHMDAMDGSSFPDIVLIGASTGGIAALESVLRSFPADCPPTLVVQHIREGFVAGLVRRLNASIRPRASISPVMPVFATRTSGLPCSMARRRA